MNSDDTLAVRTLRRVANALGVPQEGWTGDAIVEAAQIVVSERAALRAKVAELEAADRWIPVTERLPEEGIEVLVKRETIIPWATWVERDGLWFDACDEERIEHRSALEALEAVVDQCEGDVRDVRIRVLRGQRPDEWHDLSLPWLISMCVDAMEGAANPAAAAFECYVQIWCEHNQDPEDLDGPHPHGADLADLEALPALTAELVERVVRGWAERSDPHWLKETGEVILVTADEIRAMYPDTGDDEGGR